MGGGKGSLTPYFKFSFVSASMNFIIAKYGVIGVTVNQEQLLLLYANGS